ncbi:hypothetical protein [Stenotrophobium rhamnosiphilum]|nr:hypothetical protein [Stenotrophobium rhamnosiphilum]
MNMLAAVDGNLSYSKGSNALTHGRFGEREAFELVASIESA